MTLYELDKAFFFPSVLVQFASKDPLGYTYVSFRDLFELKEVSNLGFAFNRGLQIILTGSTALPEG